MAVESKTFYVRFHSARLQLEITAFGGPPLNNVFSGL